MMSRRKSGQSGYGGSGISAIQHRPDHREEIIRRGESRFFQLGVHRLDPLAGEPASQGAHPQGHRRVKDESDLFPVQFRRLLFFRPGLAPGLFGRRATGIPSAIALPGRPGGPAPLYSPQALFVWPASFRPGQSPGLGKGRSAGEAARTARRPCCLSLPPAGLARFWGYSAPPGPFSLFWGGKRAVLGESFRNFARLPLTGAEAIRIIILIV